MAALSARLGGQAIEIWFADEARVGQKNKLTRRWARRGSHPSAPKDQRTASVYLFGAICPALGKGAGLVLPRCTTDGMAWQLAEVSRLGRMVLCWWTGPVGMCRASWRFRRT